MKRSLVFIAACFLLSPVNRSSAAERIRVAFVSPSAVQSVPWIAKETGIFAKYGLDAEVILLTGSPRLVQSLIAGDVDYALVGVTAVMRARLRGAEVVVLATTTNVSNQKLMVTRRSGIRQLEDLKGRVIGVSQYGSEADTFARIALGKVGLKPDRDVAILQLGGHPQVAAALAAGKIEAGVLGGLASLTTQQAGALLLTSAVELKTLSPSGTLTTTRSTIQRNRDSVARFMRSYLEALHYFKTNRTGTIAILQKYMGGISAHQAGFLYDEQVDLLEPLPIPNEKGLQAVLDREDDPKARNFNPADFVDLSFLKEIGRSGLIENLYRK